MKQRKHLARQYLRAKVDVSGVEHVGDHRRFALECDLIGGTQLHLTEGQHLTADVGMTKESKHHRLALPRLQQPIDWQDVKHLSNKQMDNVKSS